MNSNGEQEPAPPPEPAPSEPDEGFETQIETYTDEPGEATHDDDSAEGFETGPSIRAPKEGEPDQRPGEGFEIERQT
jgi:hypothetical protein